jgi:biopolymer transport protein TolR
MAFSTSTRNRRPTRHQPLADLNVTPLVDVMLVLLIVFMITAPLLTAGLKVDLPQARSALPQNVKEPLVITIAKDGTVTLGVDAVGRDQLASAIRALLAGADRPIHLRGDRETPYGEIVAVMDQLIAQGLTKVALLANSKVGSPAAPAAPPTARP